MTTDNSPDLFGHKPAQGDLFANEPPRAYQPPKIDPNNVRRKLLKMLDEARAATDRSPWPYQTMRCNRVIFPQMCGWLPDDEAARLRLEFAAELERLHLTVQDVP